MFLLDRILTLWPYEIAVIAYSLWERGEGSRALFLLLYMLMQLYDSGKFLSEGSLVESSCAFAGNKVLGHILLPSLDLSQHLLKAMPLFQPTNTARDNSRLQLQLQNVYPPLLSSYRFLSVATHIFVIVGSLQSDECGQETNDSVQALAYAGVLVYTVSLPAKAGAIFALTLSSLLLLVWEINMLVSNLAPSVLSSALFKGAFFSALYAVVFLCEDKLLMLFEHALSPSDKIVSFSFSRDTTANPSSLPPPPPPAPQQQPSSHREAGAPLRHVYSRYPILSVADQLREQQLVRQQREQQQLSEADQREQQRPDTPSSKPKSPRCKFPVRHKSGIAPPESS